MHSHVILSTNSRENLPDFPTHMPSQKLVYVAGSEQLYLKLMPGGETPFYCHGTRFSDACNALDPEKQFIYVFQIPEETDTSKPLGVENLVRVLYDRKTFDTAATLEMGLGMPGCGHTFDTYLRLAEPFFRITHTPIENEEGDLRRKMYGMTTLFISYNNWRKGDDKRAETFMDIITGGLVTARQQLRDGDEDNMNGYWADFQARLMDTGGRIITFPVPVIGEVKTVSALTKLVHLTSLVREENGFTSSEAELLYTLIDKWREELPEGKVYNHDVLNLGSPNSLRSTFEGAVDYATARRGILVASYGLKEGRLGEETRRARSMSPR